MSRAGGQCGVYVLDFTSRDQLSVAINPTRLPEGVATKPMEEPLRAVSLTTEKRLIFQGAVTLRTS